MLFCTYLDLLPLNLVYFVLENGNFVLEKSWKIIFPWLWKPCIMIFLWILISKCIKLLPRRVLSNLLIQWRSIPMNWFWLCQQRKYPQIVIDWWHLVIVLYNWHIGLFNLQAEQRKLVLHNAGVIEFARGHGFDVVDTFNMTMARYKDFLQGKCACHFHRVS